MMFVMKIDKEQWPRTFFCDGLYLRHDRQAKLIGSAVGADQNVDLSPRHMVIAHRTVRNDAARHTVVRKRDRLFDDRLLFRGQAGQGGQSTGHDRPARQFGLQLQRMLDVLDDYKRAARVNPAFIGKVA